MNLTICIAALVAANPPSIPCDTSTTPGLREHIAAMAETGWGVVHAQAALPMLGCGAATEPRDCFIEWQDMSGDVANPNVPQTVRLLDGPLELSHLWIRSSADGRFVGRGIVNGKQAVVSDLQAVHSKSARAHIDVDALADPSFAADNRSFSFAGMHENSTALCRQSLLTDIAHGMGPPIVRFDSERCAGISRQMYQSIGAALTGHRYFMAHGVHMPDDGGNRSVPFRGFNPAANFTVVPVLEDASGRLLPGAPTTIPTPFEGDVQLSPSTHLAVTRFGVGEGYRFYLLDSAPDGQRATATLAGTLCMRGAKPALSFDERYLATHRYEEAYTPSRSDIVVADLLSGEVHVLTHMGPQQFALYPHFRADGWLYFLVRDMQTRQEFVAATDAVLRL